jgi:four helix bundle protein
MGNKGYEDLMVWHKATDFVTQVYLITKSLPKEELYELTSQLRRSAASVSANIAEGCARNNLGEFRRFLGIATGSLPGRIAYSFAYYAKCGLLKKEDFNNMLSFVTEIRKMLNGLKANLG